MTCEECEQILLDASNCSGIRKDWMLGVSVLNLAKAHALSCQVCAAKMSEISNIDESLNALRISSTRLEAPAAIGENLLAAFRERTKGLSSPIIQVFPWKLVWGSAAVLVLVAVVFTLYSGLNLGSPAMHTDRAVARERSGSEPAVQEPLPSISSASGAALDNLKARRDASVAKRPAPAGSGNAVAKFDHPPVVRTKQRSSMPVPDDWSLNGGGSIVRVTLPLSTLVAMGVPVHPDTSDPRVTADVTMDPFGAVMGIRLVEARTSVN
jgi:hypothetical protein